MGWVKQIPAPAHNGRPCPRPDSDKGKAFAPGSVWQCDDEACKLRWRFSGYQDDQLDGWDKWEPVVMRGDGLSRAAGEVVDEIRRAESLRAPGMR